MKKLCSGVGLQFLLKDDDMRSSASRTWLLTAVSECPSGYLRIPPISSTCSWGKRDLIKLSGEMTKLEKQTWLRWKCILCEVLLLQSRNIILYPWRRSIQVGVHTVNKIIGCMRVAFFYSQWHVISYPLNLYIFHAYLHKTAYWGQLQMLCNIIVVQHTNCYQCGIRILIA